MNEFTENELKKLCCTCLSRDRKLSQLCRINDGVNNLYALLSNDSEAYREGFYKDTASLFICWECCAIMQRISKFKEQACVAQKQLTEIADGRVSIKSQNKCLSRLSKYYIVSYITIISDETDSLKDNFIDCGPIAEVKIESDDDIPLSELHYASDCENAITLPVSTINTPQTVSTIELPPLISNTGIYEKKSKLKNGKNIDGFKKYYSTVVMSEVEMTDSRDKRKMDPIFINTKFKCDNCIEVFKTEIDLAVHSSLHLEKENAIQCDICLRYVNPNILIDHKASHFERYICQLCENVSYLLEDILKHLKREHSVRNNLVKRKKNLRSNDILQTGSKPRKNQSVGYLCTECDKYFDNKNQRWKHVQRHHREGYKCGTCGKRFAFKNSLNRHEQVHKAPPPREECPVCHKMIRVDLLKIHSRIHSARERLRCAACDKCFVSRASYEHHLKYTQAHAAGDILKYKCATCDKGYRSRGELRDHINYQHMGKTQHKCPVCGKALATRRCITRHVRRAHDGVKENARNKICQQCGKAFRDKKGLREHEFIHTGERPLACELCGGTFRQSASLYTHRKRVHNLHPQKKCVQIYHADVAS